MMKRYAAAAGLALLILVAGGCRGMMGGGVRPADPAKVVPLSPLGEHEDLWRTGDLMVAYGYERIRERLTISGEMTFAGSITNFNYIDHFRLTCYFVDGENTVIGSQGLISAAFGRSIEGPFRFSRTVTLPPGVKGIAFGYSGEVRDNGPHWDSVSWSFWETPY